MNLVHFESAMNLMNFMNLSCYSLAAVFGPISKGCCCANGVGVWAIATVKGLTS